MAHRRNSDENLASLTTKDLRGSAPRLGASATLLRSRNRLYFWL